MAGSSLRRIGVHGLLALTIWPIGALAEEDALLATVNRPATITATRAPSRDEGPTTSPTGPARRSHVIITIKGYRPTADCTPVEIVVRGRIGSGAETEVGRFGITPDREFNATEPSKVQRFSLPLPSELATDQPVKFSIHLLPITEGRSGDVPCTTNEATAHYGPSLNISGAVIR